MALLIVLMPACWAALREAFGISPSASLSLANPKRFALAAETPSVKATSIALLQVRFVCLV
jgi:hypothetical protein